MTIFQAIILGLIQGLTEFIPVSSSGHLYLIPQLLGWATPSTIFITVLDWGTLIALIYYYREKIFKYIKVSLKFVSLQGKIVDSDDSKTARMIFNIILATIPAGIIGFLAEKIISKFYDTPENLKLPAILTVGVMIIVGFIFIFSDRFFKNNSGGVDDLKWNKALLIGISQALAFIRGVSRSGITLLVGQSLKLTAHDAAEFTFLISIPIILVSTLYETYQLFTLPGEELSQQLPLAIIGSFFALISGIIAIRFLLNYLKTKGLKNFGIYRVIFGIAALIIILIR